MAPFGSYWSVLYHFSSLFFSTRPFLTIRFYTCLSRGILYYTLACYPVSLSAQVSIHLGSLSFTLTGFMGKISEKEDIEGGCRY